MPDLTTMTIDKALGFHSNFHHLFIFCLLLRLHLVATVKTNYSLGLPGPLTMGEPLSACCLEGFQWDGVPAGVNTTLGANNAYVTGPADSKAAILVIHDLFGWTFPNIRLLADYYAREVGARVWVPDL